jgi:hypothetical protein
MTTRSFIHKVSSKKVLVAVLAALFVCVVNVRADSFDFSFSGSGVSGSGDFTTLPLDTLPDGSSVDLGGYIITSLDGELNGMSMVLLPWDGSGKPVNGMDGFGNLPPAGTPLTVFTEFNFLNNSLYFTVDGQEYEILDIDQGPVDILGLDLREIGGEGTVTPISMCVVQTVDAPETGTVWLLAIGLGAILLAAHLPGKLSGRKVL